jgi:citrate synthase
LILRGHYLQDIAGQHSFEWLTGLLWQDFVQRDLDEAVLRRDLGLAREHAFRRMHDLLPLAGRLPPLAAVRMLLASVPDDAENAPLLLTATVAVGLAAVIRIRRGHHPVPPDAGISHAADFLRMLKDAPPTPEDAAALETYLLCSADHGLNASTFAARVAASTQASLTDAVTAALCALKGPLHGGAPGPVLDTLDAIGPVANAENWLDAAVMHGDRLMGFGHRMYRVRDPRCDVVKAVVSRLNRRRSPCWRSASRAAHCRPTMSSTPRCCWRRSVCHAMRSPAHSPLRAWWDGSRTRWSSRQAGGSSGHNRNISDRCRAPDQWLGEEAGSYDPSFSPNAYSSDMSLPV